MPLLPLACCDGGIAIPLRTCMSVSGECCVLYKHSPQTTRWPLVQGYRVCACPYACVYDQVNSRHLQWICRGGVTKNSCKITLICHRMSWREIRGNAVRSCSHEQCFAALMSTVGVTERDIWATLKTWHLQLNHLYRLNQGRLTRNYEVTHDLPVPPSRTHALTWIKERNTWYRNRHRKVQYIGMTGLDLASDFARLDSEHTAFLQCAFAV